jgi:hypothetical protein
MGELVERVKLNLLVYGDGLVENFRNNSLYFYDKYQKSDNEVKNVKVSDVYPGGFYFFHYKDDSNWMKWSPVFIAGYKKFSNQKLMMKMNFNFFEAYLEFQVYLKY